MREVRGRRAVVRRGGRVERDVERRREGGKRGVAQGEGGSSCGLLLLEGSRGGLLLPLSREVDEAARLHARRGMRGLGERVKVSVNVPEDVVDINIPPLLLIPLLENAYKHGVSATEQSFIDCFFEIRKLFVEQSRGRSPK